MKKLFKRFGAMFIVVAMLVAMIPMTIFAEGEENTYAFYLTSVGRIDHWTQNYPEGTRLEVNGNYKIQSSDPKTYKVGCYDGSGWAAADWIKFSLNGEELTGAPCANPFDSRFISLINDDSIKGQKLPTDNAFTEGNWITVAAIGVDDNDVPYIKVEKRTGIYVDGEAYESGDTVTTSNTITYYNDNGEQVEFRYKIGERGWESDKVDSYVPTVGTYTLSKYTVYGGTTPRIMLTPKIDVVKVEKAKLVDSFEYDTEEHALISDETKITFGGEDVEDATVQYALNPMNYGWRFNADWKDSADDIKATNAGKYEVWQKITLPDGYYLPRGYNSIQRIGEVTIAKQKLDVPTSKYEYDGTEKTGFNFEGQPYIQAYYPFAGTNTAIDADTYTVGLVLVDTANYEWADSHKVWGTYRKATWTITQREAVAKDFDCELPEDSDYDALDKEATVEVKKLLKRGDEEVIVTYKKDGNEVNEEDTYLPGTYSVYAQVSGGNNFKSDAAPVLVGSFTVNDVEVVEGNDAVFVEGTDKTLTFKANGPFNEESFKAKDKGRTFNGIKVDGYTVDPKNYDVKKGSTIVTLHNDYLKTLLADEHTITFVYADGQVTASTDFTVQAPAAPKTGDANTTVLWIVLAGLAFVSLIGGAYKFIGSDI